MTIYRGKNTLKCQYTRSPRSLRGAQPLRLEARRARQPRREGHGGDGARRAPGEAHVSGESARACSTEKLCGI